MLEVDFHTHTFFSQCGVHSHIEMLTRAKELGIKAIAITDHGPSLKSRSSNLFCRRVAKDIVPGIEMLKGMECNLFEEEGKIDLPMDVLPYMDIVLLGIHTNTPRGLDVATYTGMMVRAIEENPFVDVITHLNDPVYRVDFAPIAKAAVDRGVALEVNNSKTRLDIADPAVTEELIQTARSEGCRVVVASDAHALNEVGLDDSVMPLLKDAGFPDENLMTRNAESALAFVEERRQFKKAYAR